MQTQMFKYQLSAKKMCSASMQHEASIVVCRDAKRNASGVLAWELLLCLASQFYFPQLPQSDSGPEGDYAAQ